MTTPVVTSIRLPHNTTLASNRTTNTAPKNGGKPIPVAVALRPQTPGRSPVKVVGPAQQLKKPANTTGLSTQAKALWGTLGVAALAIVSYGLYSLLGGTEPPQQQKIDDKDSKQTDEGSDGQCKFTLDAGMKYFKGFCRDSDTEATEGEMTICRMDQEQKVCDERLVGQFENNTLVRGTRYVGDKVESSGSYLTNYTYYGKVYERAFDGYRHDLTTGNLLFHGFIGNDTFVYGDLYNVTTGRLAARGTFAKNQLVRGIKYEATDYFDTFRTRYDGVHWERVTQVMNCPLEEGEFNADGQLVKGFKYLVKEQPYQSLCAPNLWYQQGEFNADGKLTGEGTECQDGVCWEGSFNNGEQSPSLLSPGKRWQSLATNRLNDVYRIQRPFDALDARYDAPSSLGA